MTPPADNTVDIKEPLAVAVWAEARARWSLDCAETLPQRGLGAKLADVQGLAYFDVARLIVGLTRGATLREVRAEIYLLGHARGVVPWEDPEAEERGVDDFHVTCSVCGKLTASYVAEPMEYGHFATCSACLAVPVDSDAVEGEGVTTGEEGLRR